MAHQEKEVFQSKAGIDYVQPKKLSSKVRVYTQAFLEKIPHSTEGKIDVCLKIGRYKLNGAVETKEPKSELTLENDELNNLIKYLEENYRPIKLGKGKYIAIDDSEASQLLYRFKSVVSSDENTARQLLESGVLTDNVYFTVNMIKKKDAYDDFCKRIEEDRTESDWQEWFEKNKWMLGSEYIEILNERKIDAWHISDYLLKAFDGFVDLVEIKTPNCGNFWMNSTDHNNYVPSTDLVKAITQCQNYIYEIERESNSEKFLERTKGTKVIKPRCVLVFGRSKWWNDEQRKAYRILNASYNQVTILTYDHLAQRAKNLLELDEKSEINTDDLPF